MDPATDVALDELKSLVGQRINFKTDLAFRVKELVAAGGAVTVEIRAKTKYGFFVTYVPGEAEVQQNPSAVADQLNALAFEGVASRYAEIVTHVRRAANVVMDDKP